MNDRLFLENYLLNLKSTVEVYVHGTSESSNSDVREVLNDSLNDILDSQEDTYNKMVECGWYEVENVDISTIDKTLTKLNDNN